MHTLGYYSLTQVIFLFLKIYIFLYTWGSSVFAETYTVSLGSPVGWIWEGMIIRYRDFAECDLQIYYLLHGGNNSVPGHLFKDKTKISYQFCILKTLHVLKLKLLIA